MTTGRLIDIILEKEETKSSHDPRHRDKKIVITMASHGLSYEAIKLVKPYRKSTTYSGVGKLLRSTNPYFKRSVNFSKYAQNLVTQKIEEQLLAYNVKKRNIVSFIGGVREGVNVQITWYWQKPLQEFSLEKPLEEIYQGRLQRIYTLVSAPEDSISLDDREKWRKLEVRMSMASKSNDTKNIISLYNEMKNMYPNSIEILSEYAKFCKEEKLNSEAIGAYKQLLGFLPFDEIALASIGELYFLEGNIDQSIFFLRRAEFETPSEVEVLSKLGDIYAQRNELEHAYFYYLRYTELMGPFEGHQQFTDDWNRKISTGTIGSFIQSNPVSQARFDCLRIKRTEIQREIESYYYKANDLKAKGVQPIRPE